MLVQQILKDKSDDGVVTHDLTVALEAIAKSPQVLNGLSARAAQRASDRNWDKSLQPFLRQLHTWFPERFQSIRRTKVAPPQSKNSKETSEIRKDGGDNAVWQDPVRQSSAQ